MCRIQVCFAIVGITLLFALPLMAQTTQPTATFTSSTELVLIPTVVNDKSGVHIAGLHREEFALKQDGKSLPIAVFEEVKTSSARVRRSEGEHGTFSNFETGGSDYHRLNIIVLDFVNTPFSDQANARNELFKFLSEAAESGCGTQVKTPNTNAGTLIGMLPLAPVRVDFEGFPKFTSNTYL